MNPGTADSNSGTESRLGTGRSPDIGVVLVQGIVLIQELFRYRNSPDTGVVLVQK